MIIYQTFTLPALYFRIKGNIIMKDKLEVFMTTRGCKDAQYRIDKVFSRILGLCSGKKGKKEDEVRDK
jgi:hypothetical protein